MHDCVMAEPLCGVAEQVVGPVTNREAQDLASATVVAGARLADAQPSPERWRVLLDPAGHPFCFMIMIAPA